MPSKKAHHNSSEPSTAARSLARKTECAWKKADALLKCEQKAETPGRPPDPNTGGCIDKARLKFDGGTDPASGCVWRAFFADPAGCITGDGPALETLIDGCVSQIVAEIDPAPLDQSRCNAQKKKCAAKKLKSMLKCYERAHTPGKPDDPNAAVASTGRWSSLTVGLIRPRVA